MENTYRVVNFDNAVDFIKRIQNRYAGTGQYQDFLQLLDSFTKNNETNEEMIKKLNNLFYDSPDLLDEIKLYIGPERICQAQGAAQVQVEPGSSSSCDTGTTRLRRRHHSSKPMSGPSHSQVRPGSSSSSDKGVKRTMKTQGGAETKTNGNIFVRCEGSYGLLLHDDDELCSGRTDLDREVLNDSWRFAVNCRPVDDKTSSSSNPKQTQYEKMQHQVVDYRYEFDHIMVATREAVFKLETMINAHDKVHRNYAELSNDLMTPSVRIVIERLYGKETGGLVFNGLLTEPQLMLPVVIMRLKSKLKEWDPVLNKQKRLWEETVAEARIKELDAQIVAVKLADSKMLRSKGLLEDKSEVVLHYSVEEQVLADATDILVENIIHLGMSSEEQKRTMTYIIAVFLPHLLGCVSSELKELGVPGTAVYFCSKEWYLLLRCHHMLCDRLQEIKRIAAQVVCKNQIPPGLSDVAKNILKSRPSFHVGASTYYGRYVNAVKALLEGNLPVSGFENLVREMFGDCAARGVTLDRMVHAVVRQLKNITWTRRLGWKDGKPLVTMQVMELFLQHQQRALADATPEGRHVGFHEYLRHAHYCLRGYQTYRVVVERNAPLRMTFMKECALVKSSCRAMFGADCTMGDLRRKKAITLHRNPTVFLSRNKRRCHRKLSSSLSDDFSLGLNLRARQTVIFFYNGLYRDQKKHSKRGAPKLEDVVPKIWSQRQQDGL